METKRNYQLLDQFKGMECTIFSRPIDNDAVDTQYINKSFNYDLDEHFLHFKDATSNQVKTTVRLDEIDDILNLGNDVDVYDDLVKISTYYHTTYYVHTIEKKPIPIHCDKCGYEFAEEDQMWFINQRGEWGSIHDGDLISVRLCDNCVSYFINKVPSNNYDYLGGEYHE